LYSCKSCHAAILKDAVFCPQCGALVSAEKRELLARERVSWAWWLLPIFAIPSLNFIGGIIAWAFNRYRDPRKATYMLWLGVSLTLIYLIIQAVFVYT
jgi:predicted nucleic acid-binding Zn ribbon protein